MNSGDYIEELKEGFRISETQEKGNESAFKSILNEVREYKKNLTFELQSQQGSVSTQNSWHVSRQSFQSNQDLQSLIEMETLKQNQFYAVITTMERKITDYKKKTDKINELLEGFNLDDAAAQQESQQSNQLLQQSKKNAIAASEYLQLLKNSQNQEKQKLLDKHETILQDIRELQTEYSEYRQKFQQKSEIIQQQRQVIQSLEESKANLEQKQFEQQTVVCYSNTIKLMDEMFHKYDPRKLFEYRFEQRQQIIQQKKKQSQIQTSNQITHLFATQVEFEELESPPVIEEETDLMILEMIKQPANLNELDIQMDLLAFAEVVVQKYQEYKEQFDRLGFQFILLNERKYDLEQQMRETVHFKYQETSNGLLPIKLNDNFNSKQVTLNILSTSVELDLTEQRTEQEVKRIQNAVIRLFHFVKNHVARTNHLVKHIQEISDLVPSSVFIVINDLKNTCNVNEIIRTPAPKKPSVLVSQVLDQKSEFLHVKNQKQLTQKTMLSTTYLPKKQIHSPSIKFKYFNLVQKFIKSLLSDEIERLFVQQDMIDEQIFIQPRLIREVQKHCEEIDPNEETLMRYLKTKQLFFEHRLQQRTREMLKNAFSKLGEAYNKLKYECSQLRLKGLDFQEKKFQSGCIFNQKDLQSDKRSASNQFVSSQQSFDNTIDQSEHSRAKGGKDVFHLLKKLTNVNDIQEAGQQESEDSIDKERVKFKQQNYYIKSQIFAKDQSQKNLDDDVFYRLNPQRTNPNKQTRNQLGILRHMRISAARSSCSIDQDLKTEIWKMTCPVQPKVKTRKDTFRKLFNSSEKKLTDLQSQKKVQTRSFNLNNLPRSTYTTSDDAESVWKKKYRAKKILNALSAKENKKERFGILEAI